MVTKTKKTEKTDKRRYPELDIEKETVILLITEKGLSIKQAALAIHKTPNAVYQWMRKDPDFISALQRQKELFLEEIKASYSNLPELAYKAIRNNLESSDPDAKLALAYLKESGNLIKTNEKSNADEKTLQAANMLVAELLAIADQAE